MTTLREAAQQALEYMKFIGKMDMHPEKWAIIGRLEAALAEPVQEPVGAVLVNRESREGVMFYSVDMIPDPSTLKDRFELVPVYTAPPQRPAEPVQEQPVCDECGKHKRDGWALYCVDCVEPVFALSQPPDSKHAKEKA